jgi:hypothetical protein
MRTMMAEKGGERKLPASRPTQKKKAGQDPRKAHSEDPRTQHGDPRQVKQA